MPCYILGTLLLFHRGFTAEKVDLELSMHFQYDERTFSS